MIGISGSTAIRLATLLLFFVITLTMFGPAGAIQCWDCSSAINSKCADPFQADNFAMIDCNQRHTNATLCRKIVQKIQGESSPRIVRTCGWIEDSSTDRECVKRSGTFSILIEYCTCSTDGCNSAITQNLSALLSATALGLLVWLRI